MCGGQIMPPPKHTHNGLHQSKSFHFKVQNVFYQCIFHLFLSKIQISGYQSNQTTRCLGSLYSCSLHSVGNCSSDSLTSLRSESPSIYRRKKDGDGIYFSVSLDTTLVSKVYLIVTCWLDNTIPG